MKTPTASRRRALFSRVPFRQNTSGAECMGLRGRSPAEQPKASLRGRSTTARTSSASAAPWAGCAPSRQSSNVPSKMRRRSPAAQWMAGHKVWIEKGLGDEVFLRAGSLDIAQGVLCWPPDSTRMSLRPGCRRIPPWRIRSWCPRSSALNRRACPRGRLR